MSISDKNDQWDQTNQIKHNNNVAMFFWLNKYIIFIKHIFTLINYF